MSNGNCGGSVDCAWGCPGCKGKRACIDPDCPGVERDRAAPEMPKAPIGWKYVMVRYDHAGIWQNEETWDVWRRAAADAASHIAMTAQTDRAKQVVAVLRAIAARIPGTAGL